MNQYFRFPWHFSGRRRSILACLRTALTSGLAFACQLLLLCAAESAFASTINLAPGLDAELPDSLVVGIFEETAPGNAPVLVGEVGGEAGYFIAANRIKTRDQNLMLWKKLEAEIRKRSTSRNLISEKKGNFYTRQNKPVWFRSYQYETAGQEHRQVYFLLRNDEVVYWITMTAVEDVSMDTVIPVAEALIRRVTLTDD